MKKQKIAVIGTVGLPAKYGGFETLTEHLVNNLGDQYDFTVYCSKKRYSKTERTKTYKNAQLRYINLEANGIQSILYDTLSILLALRKHQVLLILGVAGAWILPFVKFFTNRKIIISIDGIEWKRDKWNLLAKLYLAWAEKVAVRFSHIDISDNESIQDYTALRYQTLSRVIEYGADHTQIVKPTTEDIKRYPFLNNKYAIKVCRIEPENNLHMVIEAFYQYKKLQLVVVGNWNNSEYGKNLKTKYNNVPNILLLDPIYDQRTIDLIRCNATVYIHGHSAGGTNPSLVEAMYLGLPIFSYGVSYNKTTTAQNALYFKNTNELISLLETTTENELVQLGIEMKKIALKKYTWKKISHQYHLLIKEALVVKTKTKTTPYIKKLNYNFLNSENLSHLKNQYNFYDKN